MKKNIKHCWSENSGNIWKNNLTDILIQENAVSDLVKPWNVWYQILDL